MNPALLDDRAILAVSGPDARTFLQGLITQDMNSLTPGRGLYAALLSPQGKILFDFLLAEGDGAILIDVAAGQRDALLRKLTLYRLRAKVEIQARDQLGVYLDLSGHPQNRATPYTERAVTFADPRLAALGSRSIGARAEMPAQVAGPAEYHENRLALGVPEAGDFGQEKVFALDAGLEELHGVSFTKGCYMGQELTSRMKHRATTRKRILTVTGQQPLPASGMLRRGGSEIGEILSSHGTTAFALVRLDRFDEAQGDVTLDELAVALSRPAWLDL